MYLQRRITAVITVLLLFGAGFAAGSGQNDAGTGHDAGDSEAQATLLPSVGTYSGSLVDSTDADWYEITDAQAGGGCVEAHVVGDLVAGVALRFPGSGYGAMDQISTEEDVHLPVAAPQTSSMQLAVEPELSILSPLGGSYQFTLDPLTFSDLQGTGDAWTGGDVGDTPTSAAQLPAGCFGGAIDPNDADLYTFQAEEGDTLLVSLATKNAADLSLTLIDPAGYAVLELSPGEIDAIDLATGGDWTLAMQGTSTSSDGQYVIGALLDGDGPDPRPCQPSC